jgi:hypothetical protein
MGAPVGGERLPVAPRERKPALAALAVLLILVGALGATVMVMRAGDKITVVEISANVAAGEPIPADAIRAVDVSDVGDKNVVFVRWGQHDQLRNWVAATNLVPGTLLVDNMLVDKKTSTQQSGKAKVGLSLKDGQYPDDLKAGDIVAAYRVGNDAAKAQSGSGSGSDSTDGGAGSNLISSHLVVLSPPHTSGGLGGGDAQATVLADASDAGALTIAASADEVALVLVSGKS